MNILEFTEFVFLVFLIGNVLGITIMITLSYVYDRIRK